MWKDVETTVRGLLSKAGTARVNPASGTITVRDSYARLEAVRAYIDEVNERLSRQIALCVRVWALEVNDASSAGINLQALFSSPRRHCRCHRLFPCLGLGFEGEPQGLLCSA